jgi:hypothetical protein
MAASKAGAFSVESNSGIIKRHVAIYFFDSSDRLVEKRKRRTPDGMRLDHSTMRRQTISA